MIGCGPGGGQSGQNGGKQKMTRKKVDGKKWWEVYCFTEIQGIFSHFTEIFQQKRQLKVSKRAKKGLLEVIFFGDFS